MREIALNRPVHLAGRDAYYECAMKTLQGNLMSYDVADRMERCRSASAALSLAHDHANFALRGIDPCREELLFVDFLQLLQDSVQSLQVLTKHEHLMISEQDVLQEFLRESPEEIARSAAEHRQLAEGLLKETLQLIQMAADAWQRLRAANQTSCGTECMSRYRRAYESFQRQAL